MGRRDRCDESHVPACVLTGGTVGGAAGHRGSIGCALECLPVDPPPQEKTAKWAGHQRPLLSYTRHALYERCSSAAFRCSLVGSTLYLSWPSPVHARGEPSPSSEDFRHLADKKLMEIRDFPRGCTNQPLHASLVAPAARTNAICGLRGRQDTSTTRRHPCTRVAALLPPSRLLAARACGARAVELHTMWVRQGNLRRSFESMVQACIATITRAGVAALACGQSE